MIYPYIREKLCQHAQQILQDEERTLTYRQALIEAERLAPALTGAKYGLYCRSELNTAIALLACLAAGRTAVPLSYRYGRIHTDRIARHLSLTHILTDEDGTLEVKQIAPPSPEREDLGDIACILCTSGTTGLPKGVMLSQRNLYTNVTDIEGYFALRDTDALLIARPLYHGAVLTGEFLVGVCKGVRLCFVNSGFHPAGLVERLRTQSASVLCGTPTLFHHISRLAVRERQPLPLRMAAVSGECLTPHVARELRQALPETAVYHVYGMTEAGPRISYLEPELFDSMPCCVGRALPSLTTRIEAGELLLRGGSIMKGYYNDPERTAEVLRDGWLHTGDLADQDAQGRIVIRARKDHMIIRAGMNVYPQAIENVLLGDPRIAEAMVYGVRDASGTQKIHVQVVADRLSRAALLDLCRQQLPAHELPDHVEFVEALPRSASGKLIRPRT